MKKIFQLVFASLFSISLISCGSSKTSSSSIDSKIESSSLESSSSSLSISSSSELSSSSSSSSSEASSSKQESSSSSSSSSIAVYYHVIFQNYDETILEEKDVLEGSEAIYSGQTPEKAEDDEFTYEFIGWDQELKEIHSNVTTTAQFKAVPKENWGPIHWF